MKILNVCNNAYTLGNGISTSAVNISRYLRKAGQEVRMLSAVNPDPDGTQPAFPLKKFYFPIFQPLIDANGFCYAKIDRGMIREAVSWADVVHIEEPLFLQKAVIKEAGRQGKPVTGTFHLYTQNILDEIPLASFRLSNHIMMCDWRDNFFNHCSDIQCPTPTVKALLESYGFKSRLHVISNGVEIPDERVIARPSQGEPFILLNVSRFAVVKNQSVLLDAMHWCRNARRIQLYFAGKGQLECRCRRQAAELIEEGVLRYEPIFGFYSKEELRDLASRSYLYVHTAKLEVEGLGCIEALREGTVPVIAKGPLIATSDFALDGRSTFDVNDPKELASRIDYWIEHPEERDRMAQLYADEARKYDICRSAASLVKMYEQALGCVK